MKLASPHLASLALAFAVAPAASLAAQELVTNGGFDKGLAGWTLRGFAVNPKLDSFDVQGIGASACFGANPGGKVLPPPYGPIVLVQSLTISSSKRYALHAQVAVAASESNLDAGTFELWFDGRLVDRIAFGAVQKGQVLRGRLCGQVFWPGSGSKTDLLVACHRRFTATLSTPRVYFDEISVREATGPVLCLRDDRKLGSRVTLEVETAGNLQWVAWFLSTVRLAQGVRIPGFAGQWVLDAKTLQLLFVAQTTNARKLRLPVTLPSTPSLHAAPLWLQGLKLRPFAFGPEDFLPPHR